MIIYTNPPGFSGASEVQFQRLSIREEEYEALTDAGIFVDMVGSSTDTVIRGVHARVTHNDNAGDPGSASTAMWGEMVYSGDTDNNLDHVIGVQAYASHRGTGMVDNVTGVNIHVDTDGTGAIGSLHGIFIQTPVTSVEEISNAYGIFIADIGSVGSVASYSIFTGTGTAHFGGPVECVSTLSVDGGIAAGLDGLAPSFPFDLKSATTATLARMRSEQTSAAIELAAGDNNRLFVQASSFNGHGVIGEGLIPLLLGTNTTVQWIIDATGHLTPGVSDAKDIGSAALQIRDVHIGRDLHVDQGVFLNGLPTSDPVVANQVWNDSGTLKISAG